MDDISKPFEDQEIRCPKLGGPVTFSYCCVEAIDLPCSRAIKCWCDRFDVESFFRRNLGHDKFQLAFEKIQQSRLDNILELIERAQKLNLENSKQPE